MNLAKDILDEKLLYKFRSIVKNSSDHAKPDQNKIHYVERIFTHNELYFPSPIDLNDPLECRPLVTLGDLSDQRHREKESQKGQVSTFNKPKVFTANLPNIEIYPRIISFSLSFQNQ